MDLQLRKAEKEQSNRVAITALERDGKLLMGLRGDTKKWGFPGGHLLQDESPLEGASRELFEETGLSPNGGEIQTVGDQFNETAGKHIHLFHGHCSDGEPTAVNDPDGEFQDFGWFGPEEIERLDLHIPPEQCIVHQMLLAEPMTKSEAPTWRSNQGLVIPASGTPQRIEFDANFLGHIVDLYAGGDIARIKKHLVQLSKVKTDKQPTSQDLVEFYTQMLQNGEAVPGLVVRRDDAGDLFLVDGINRYAALESAGEAKTWVYEILNDFAKSEETLTKTRPGPRFPKLGLPDDRRETEIVDRVGEWKKKFYIRAATVDLINRVVPKKERAETQENADENLIGDRMGMSAPAMRFGASPYAVTDSELGSKWGPSTPIATRNHENAHMLFGRVRKMYGQQARQNLAENIWHHVENRLGPEKSGILNQYLSVRYPEAQRNGLDHEERMATVLNLVNDPAERKNLLGNKTQDINLVADIGKQAHQAMLEGGRLADAHWLKSPDKFQKKYATGVFQKSEAEDFSIEDPTAWNSSYLHDDLHPLAHLESEFGTAIKPNRQDGAVGAVALKPKVAWEAYAKSPTLQKLFPGLDQVSFLQKLSEDHKLYNLVSSAVFAAAKAKHGTPEKAVFAWRYGNAIANRATDQQVLADPYVRQYSELLGNQLAEQPLNKSLEYVVNNTTGSTWKSSYGVDLVVSRDPHDRSQWRTTVLVKAEPVRHFVAKNHYDALLTAESLGADFGNPGHSLLKAEVPQPPSWIPDELKPNWKLAAEKYGPDYFERATEDADPRVKELVLDTVKKAHWPDFEDLDKPGVKIPDDMFKEVFNSVTYPESWKRKIARNPSLTSEQTSKALQNPIYEVRQQAIRHPNVTPEHISKALMDKNPTVRRYAAGHNNATPEHITQALNDEDENVRGAAIFNLNATPEHITQALNDEDSSVRSNAVRHPKATPEHITQALNDEDSSVRSDAVSHPKATPEHITQALNDEDMYVRRSAIRHPNVTPEHIAQALQDPDDDVRGAAIKHPNANPEHIRQALGDKNGEIRRTAMLHPNLDVDTIYLTKVHSALGTNKLRKLRDYLEQNGGSVNKKDIPSFPQQLGKLLDHKGNLTAAKVQEHINSLPKASFNVSESEWDGAQKHSNDDSKVFQLNLTSDHLKKMKESGVYDTYRKLNGASSNSGHPVTPHTIGWVRYTGDQPGVQIDEVQSDLGSHLGAQARAQAAQNGISEDEAEAHVNKEYPPEHLKKIKDILFQGKHPSELLHETFRQHLRDKGWHNTPIHVHDVETKLPLADQDPTKPAPAHMMVGYRQHPEKMGMEPSTYGKLETQSNPELKGKKQWADVVRKSESLQKDDLQTKASPASPIATQDPQPRSQGPVNIDAVRHSLPGFLKHDEVHDLMHGLDLNQPRDHKTVGPGINNSQSYWMNGPKGKVYVKESAAPPDGDSPSDAQAEGAYHNITKDFFGMGKYMPHVGAFEHPETGNHVAVVQSVDGEHHDIDNDNHEFELQKMHNSGDLHKLALMNMLLQNTDRHKYNYLMPKEGGLKLIDHGRSFSWSNEPDLPHYVKAAHGLPNYYVKNAGSKHYKANKNIDWNNPKNLGPEIHPEAAKWAMKLNPTELKNQITSHGIHPKLANESANRLKALQVFLTQHPKASITEAYRTPQSMTSQGAFNNSQVKTGK